MRDLGREIVRSLPARNLAIVNGHGGNRGILEALAQELRADFALNVCVLHPAAWPDLDAKAAVSGNSRRKKRNVNDARDRAELGTAGSNCAIEKLTRAATLCERQSSIRPSPGHGPQTRKRSPTLASLAMRTQRQQNLDSACSIRSSEMAGPVIKQLLDRQHLVRG